MKLRNKFIVLAITLSLIPTTIGGFIVYDSVKTMLVKSLEDRLQGIATTKETLVNAYLDNLSDIMRMMSVKTMMKSYLDLYKKTGDFQFEKRIIGILNETLSVKPEISEISLYDETGKVLVSTESGKAGTVAAGDNFLTKGAKHCGLTDVFKDNDKRPDNALTVRCSCPLMTANRLIGIIVVNMDAGKLISITSDYTGLGRSGETYLARRDAAGDALFIVPLRFDKQAALTRKLSGLDTKAAMTHALSKEKGFWFSVTDYRGKEVVAATRYIDKADWGLVVKIDEPEALSQLARIRKYIVYGVLAFTMATAAIASFLTGKITGPLTALTKAAKKIVEEDSYLTAEDETTEDKQTEKPDVDEIGILVSAFNEMADTIARNRSTLTKNLVELEAGNSRLNRLLEAAFEGIAITENGLIVDANNRYAEIFGYAPEELFGMSVFNLVASQYRETVKNYVSEKYEQPYEADCLKKDGTVIRVEACGKNVEYEGGRIRIVAIQDITRRKDYETKLKETAGQLEKLNKHLEEKVKEETEKRMHKEKLLIQQSKMAAMGEMIAAIAHQWKQPLNALGLFIQDIRDAYNFGELDGAYLDTAVEKSMHEVQFMARTIEEFRDFFKPSIEKETCDLIGVLSGVFSMLLAQLKANSISYSITCHTHNVTFRSIAEVTHCDAALITTYKNQLAHVILNIINNARDAIIQRRRLGLLGEEDAGMIGVDFERCGETVRLSISDNGGGIPGKIMDKIFDPYFTTKSEIEGTGIGLYMSKIIMEEKLGGRIHVGNVEGGAVFTLELTG